MEEFVLPEWNEALKQSSNFNCSPAKHVAGAAQAKDGRAGLSAFGVGRVRPGAQPTIPAAGPSQQRVWRSENGSSLRAGGLNELPTVLEAEYWLRRAAGEQEAGNVQAAVEVLQEALQRDVRPATSIVRALQTLQKGAATSGQEEGVEKGEPAYLPAAAAAAPGAAEQPPRSARKTFTPSKTGLTGRAQRLPSRFSRTPGGALAAAEAVGAAGTAAAAAATSRSTGVKKLAFSPAKEKRGQGSRPLPAASRGSLQHGQSAIKHLHFDSSTATPAAGGRGTGSRHVTFDAATVSPAARTKPRQPSVALQTPQQPAIPEESSAGSMEEGSVSTANAGRTPYDKRLSSLVRKYAPDGTPADIAEDLLESLEGAGGQSPGWKRLSTVSVPDSIKVLSRKYTAEVEGMSPALAATPVVSITAAAQAMAEGATPGPPPSTSSPAAVAATPHELLPSYLTKNQAYESPGASPPPSAAPGGTTPAPDAAPPAAVLGQPEAEQLTPNTAIARLLGPVLQAAIDEIEGGKLAAEQQGAVPIDAAPAAGEVCGPPGKAARVVTVSTIPAPPPVTSSPVGRPGNSTPGFALRTWAAEAESPADEGTPAAAAEGEPTESPQEFGGFAVSPGMALPTDGIPRDACGIPQVTPTTVTVRRGGSRCAGSASPFPRTEGDLAANLFANFSPTEQELRAQEEQQQRRVAGEAQAAPAPPVDDGFSFFPAAGEGGGEDRQQGGGATPALDTPSAVPAAAGGVEGGGVGVSPEILGWFEALQMSGGTAGQPAEAKGEPTPADGAVPAEATPVLPKSVVKLGRLRNEDGTPVLGHAQRVAPQGEEGEAAPPPTITKELQSLMAGLTLADREGMQQWGSLPMLSPVRATAAVRSSLGGAMLASGKVITPVRRSARNQTPHKPLAAMLEDADYSYVPNVALMDEEAAPKKEAAEAKAAKMAASKAASAAQAGGSPAGTKQPEVNSTPVAASAPMSTQAATGGRRYSTRSAVKAGTAKMEEEEGEEGSAHDRRLVGQHIPTPLTLAVPDEVAATPASASLGATGPVVPQDASPKLTESPTFEAPTAAAHSYSLRTSTLRKSLAAAERTPLAASFAANISAQGQQMGGHGKASRVSMAAASTIKLSPTEQGIRSSLRRSARKSTGGARSSRQED